jgi:threonine/homoserine/homoserine lactone efflux protein
MTVYASRLGETYSVKFGLLLGATMVGIAALSTWTTLGVFLRQYMSDQVKARRSNYILGFLLALVAFDLAFHDQLLSLGN